jgi:hypothetical protein
MNSISALPPPARLMRSNRRLPAIAAWGSGIQPEREFRSNERKKMKEKCLSFPFICFHKFFGIGTYQWFTGDSNRKNLPLFPLAFQVVGEALDGSTFISSFSCAG